MLSNAIKIFSRDFFSIKIPYLNKSRSMVNKILIYFDEGESLIYSIYFRIKLLLIDCFLEPICFAYFKNEILKQSSIILFVPSMEIKRIISLKIFNYFSELNSLILCRNSKKIKEKKYFILSH